MSNYRAAIAARVLMEVAMHPYLIAQIANGHINDMQAQATAARRVRRARRAQRGAAVVSAAGRRPVPCAELA